MYLLLFRSLPTKFDLIPLPMFAKPARGVEVLIVAMLLLEMNALPGADLLV
jgi:hypothetical protein